MSHLTEKQRYTISAMMAQNISQTMIAVAIGKDKYVVRRKLRRNCDMRSGGYRYELAQRKYEERLNQKPKSIKFKAEVRERVEAMLAEDFSPEQIAGCCRLEGLDCVSHERIYQHVWADKRRGANGNMNGLIRQYIPKKIII